MLTRRAVIWKYRDVLVHEASCSDRAPLGCVVDSIRQIRSQETALKLRNLRRIGAVFLVNAIIGAGWPKVSTSALQLMNQYIICVYYEHQNCNDTAILPGGTDCTNISMKGKVLEFTQDQPAQFGTILGLKHWGWNGRGHTGYIARLIRSNTSVEDLAKPL